METLRDNNLQFTRNGKEISIVYMTKAAFNNYGRHEEPIYDTVFYFYEYHVSRCDLMHMLNGTALLGFPSLRKAVSPHLKENYNDLSHVLEITNQLLTRPSL